jgi:parvulin-like peptidyl-prolyl isomerase
MATIKKVKPRANQKIVQPLIGRGQQQKRALKLTALSLGVLLSVLAAGLFLTAGSDNIASQPLRVVLSVNGEAVTEAEYNIFLNQERADVFQYFYEKYGAKDNPTFWTTNFNGEIPLERARQQATPKLVRHKLEQNLAKQYGLLNDSSFQAFLARLEAENKRRQQAVTANQPIYGPQQYSAQNYYSYLHSNLLTELKNKLTESHAAFKFSENELESRYNVLKNSIFKLPDTIRIRKAVFPFDNAAEKSNARHAAELAEQVLNSGDKTTLKLEEQLFDTDNVRQDTDNDGLLREKAGRLAAGQVSAPLEIEGAYVIFEVLTKTDNGWRPFSEVRETVKSLLTDERFEALILAEVRRAKVEQKQILPDFRS